MALAETIPPPVKVRPELEEFFLELLAEFVTRNRPPARVQALAVCRGTDVAAFFPSDDKKGKTTREARVLCRKCPVVDECRAWARQQGPELVGTFAGESWKDRNRGQLPSALGEYPKNKTTSDSWLPVVTGGPDAGAL